MVEAQDRIVAGVELGGTKSIVLIGRGRDILVSERLPTTTPAVTLAALRQRLAEWQDQYKPEALGIGSFGPIALDKTGMDYGHMLATPKPGWAGADVAGALSEGFGERVAIHTDVTGAALAEGAAATGAATPLANEPDTFLVSLPGGLAAEGFPAYALKLCGDRAHCTVMAWRETAATPQAVPLTPLQMETMAFSYYRDTGIGIERTLWNCTVYTAMKGPRCMKRQSLTAMPITPSQTLQAGAPAPAPTPAPGELPGVRRASAAPAEAQPRP